MYCGKHTSAPIRGTVWSDRRCSRPKRWSGPVNYEQPSQHASDGSIHRYYDPTTSQFISVDPAVNLTHSPYAYAGNDPVNATDPSGLCLNSRGIETHIPCTPQQLAAIQNAAKEADAAGPAQGCSNIFSCVISDPGSVVASFNANRGQIATNVGIVVGVAAAATGAGALIDGSVLLAGVSFAAGVSASALDYGPCTNGNNAACLGLGLGFTGAVAGGIGLIGAGLVAGGIIAEDSMAAAILGGLGAFGWNVGFAGTVIDTTAGIASASPPCSG